MKKKLKKIFRDAYWSIPDVEARRDFDANAWMEEESEAFYLWTLRHLSEHRVPGF